MDEFSIAMHLVEMVKSGVHLPSKLPPELLPASYRQGVPVGHAVGLPPAQPPVAGLKILHFVISIMIRSAVILFGSVSCLL